MKIGLLISGELGERILNTLAVKYSVVAVFTDSKSTGIQQFCSTHCIPCFMGNPRNGKVDDFLKQHTCDLLLSVNYLFIVNSDILNWPSKMAINIHGSILPKYRGRTPHVWSIINDESKAGLTAHLMTDELDGGDILDHIEIEISDNDTGYSLLQKYFTYCPILAIRVIDSIQSGSYTLLKQDSAAATYFSKRTPEDGRIDWNWQKRRINNWVRALAPPYPGAFTYYKGQKIIIVRVKESNMGFKDVMENGTIISIDFNYLTVKVPNGTLELYVEDSNMIQNLKTGEIFGYE